MWVSPVLEQQFARVEFTSVRCQHQRRPPILVEGIEGGSMLDQLCHNLHMASIGGEEQSRLLGVVLLVDVDMAESDQQSTNGRKAVVTGDDERSNRFLCHA